MICKKSALRVAVFFAVLFVFVSGTFAQVFQRPRVVVSSVSTPSQPVSSTYQPPPNLWTKSTADVKTPVNPRRKFPKANI